MYGTPMITCTACLGGRVGWAAIGEDTFVEMEQMLKCQWNMIYSIVKYCCETPVGTCMCVFHQQINKHRVRNEQVARRSMIVMNEVTYVGRVLEATT